MKTILEVLELSASFLESKKVERPRREAEELIAASLGLRRLDLYVQFEKVLTEDELTKCRDFIARRGKREPRDYIIGEVSFGGGQIACTPQALIPRPETEILVEKIAVSLEKKELKGKTLLDLCTGSGCIAIAIKKRFPDLNVVASDISKEALMLAKHNCEKNRVAVTLLEGDLIFPESIDFLVSNPPYITTSELRELSPETAAEPNIALHGGDDGLHFYRRIAERLRGFQGQFWLEIGASQGVLAAQIFQTAGFSCHIEKDWAGHDRYLLNEPWSQ